ARSLARTCASVRIGAAGCWPALGTTWAGNVGTMNIKATRTASGDKPRMSDLPWGIQAKQASRTTFLLAYITPQKGERFRHAADPGFALNASQTGSSC